MANGNDYNNIFSGDYWSPDGLKKRTASQRSASKKLATTQNQNNVDVWGNVGKALGGINKPIGDFFNGLPANQRKVANAKAATQKKLPSNAGLDVKLNRNPSPASNVSSTPRYANKQQSDEAAYRGQTPEDKQQSLFDELLGKVTSDWGGVDKSKIDYSPLDAALNARMEALNGLRTKSQENFNTSDANLESMHRGFQDHINTEGAGNYNKIADQAKGNLQASNQQSQDYIANIKAQDMAKRNAMLANLGLTEESAASHDVSADPLNEAIGSIASRNDANLTNVDQDRASNLAFNQSVATSVGQQGVERRGDLAQQLQAIFGKIDMAGADAQAENAQARFQLEQGAEDRQYSQWQNKQGFLQDTLGMLQQDAQERDKMAMEQQSQDPASIGGFAGIPQDLRNSGYQDPEIQQAMGALAEVNASDDFNRDANSMAGNDKVHVYMKYLKQRGIPDALAFQAATNYVNLGSTSKYEASPY